MNIDETVEYYISLRDSISDAKKAFDNFKRETKELMDALEIELLDQSAILGVDSFTTPSGTAFKTTKTYAKMLDVNARVAYAAKTGDYGLFTNHINKLHAKELIDEGLSPEDIGVTIESEQVIQIRK